MQTVEAIYERGLLRPLSPVTLEEKQSVRLIIDDDDDDDDENEESRDAAILAWARAEAAEMEDIPTIEEVRRLLSTIPGSVSDAVIAERGAY